MKNQKLIPINEITRTRYGYPLRSLFLDTNSRIITGEILFPRHTEWSMGKWSKNGRWYINGTKYQTTQFDYRYHLKLDGIIEKYLKKQHEIYECCYCTKYITKRSKTWEHLIPISWGGSDSPKNKRTCCRTCNLFRGNMPLDKWKTKIQVLIAMNMPYKNHSVDYLKIIIRNIPIIQDAIDNATPDMYGFRKIKIYK